MRKFILVLSAMLLSLGGLATTAGAQEDPGTIVDIAAGNPDFSTLVTAVTAAELVDTLSGPGPFTVFAPTNSAFAAVPSETLDALLADPSGALTDVLSLHVISGNVSSEQAIAAAGGTVDTLGGPITVELDGENLVVGGATVIDADIAASNGTIHVIDAVITQTAPAAETAPTAAPAPVPSAVNSGDSGLAATSSTNLGLVALFGALALAGIGTSTLVLARARRES